MTTIRETCSCGASFDYSGSLGMATASQWRKEHRHEFPPMPELLPTAPDPAHIEDHTGYHLDAPSTDLHLGFTAPALTTEE